MSVWPGKVRVTIVVFDGINGKHNRCCLAINSIRIDTRASPSFCSKTPSSPAKAPPVSPGRRLKNLHIGLLAFGNGFDHGIGYPRGLFAESDDIGDAIGTAQHIPVRYVGIEANEEVAREQRLFDIFALTAAAVRASIAAGNTRSPDCADFPVHAAPDAVCFAASTTRRYFYLLSFQIMTFLRIIAGRPYPRHKRCRTQGVLLHLDILLLPIFVGRATPAAKTIGFYLIHDRYLYPGLSIRPVGHCMSL